jgi:hypothetical protein
MSLTKMTMTNLTTLKKIFEKSCSFIRKPQCRCRIFAPDLKVKGSRQAADITHARQSTNKLVSALA